MSPLKLDYPRYRKMVNYILTPKLNQNPGQVYRQWTISTHYINFILSKKHARKRFMYTTYYTAVYFKTRKNTKSASSQE